MESKFTKELFKKMQENYNKEVSVTGNYLKLVPGNIYTIRLIPRDDEHLTYQYFKHAFRSVSSGKFVNIMCPTTTGDPCPFCSKRFELWDMYVKTKDERYKDLTKPVRRTDRHLVNVYVIDDPSNPKNNGTVKLMEYGRGGTIDNCIEQAVTGMMKDEQGWRICDLSPDGMNMQIQVSKNNGGYNEYVAMFKSASALPNVTDIDKLYAQAIDLTKIPVVKTNDEIKHLLETETGVTTSLKEDVTHAPAPVATPAVATPAPVTTPVVETPAPTPAESVDKSSDGYDEVMAELSQYID